MSNKINRALNKKRISNIIIVIFCIITIVKIISTINTYGQIKGYVENQDIDGMENSFIYNHSEYIKYQKYIELHGKNENIFIDFNQYNEKKILYFHQGQKIDVYSWVYGFNQDPYESFFIFPLLPSQSEVDNLFVRKDFSYPNLNSNAIRHIRITPDFGNVIEINDTAMLSDFTYEFRTNHSIDNFISKNGLENKAFEVLVYYKNIPVYELIGKYSDSFVFTERYQ